jgi:uncharacterized damage-inducible protein DinB
MKRRISPLILGSLILLLSTRLLSASANPGPDDPAQMVADWKRAKEYTIEYLNAMPESGINFKPTPEIRSFAEQMLHIANANYAFASSASGKPNPNQSRDLEKIDSLKNREALTRAVMDSYDFVISSMQGLTAEKLAQKISVFKMELTRGLAYEKLFEHQTHHRGQTTIYLRLKGIKPPPEKLF